MLANSDVNRSACSGRMISMLPCLCHFTFRGDGTSSIPIGTLQLLLCAAPSANLKDTNLAWFRNWIRQDTTFVATRRATPGRLCKKYCHPFGTPYPQPFPRVQGNKARRFAHEILHGVARYHIARAGRRARTLADAFWLTKHRYPLSRLHNLPNWFELRFGCSGVL